MEVLRVFVGGLPRHIAEDELSSRFSKYGNVCTVEVKNKTDATGEWMKTFGYLNMEMSQQDFQKCRSQLNNTTWRDGKISIQLAKQDTSNKYAEERKLHAQPETADKMSSKGADIPLEKKGAVPGTLLPENENWVVTKFQRVVPVMNIRSKDKKKVIRYDPSRHCHQIKRLDNEKNNKSTAEEGISELTWAMDDIQSADSSGTSASDYKRKMGDFTSLVSPSKGSKGRGAAEVITQEKERRQKAFLEDDMEIVSDYAATSTTKTGAARNQPAESQEIQNGNVDLSRFDSDSDNDAEPEFIKKNSLYDSKSLTNEGASDLKSPLPNTKLRKTSASEKSKVSSQFTPNGNKLRRSFPGTAVFKNDLSSEVSNKTHPSLNTVASQAINNNVCDVSGSSSSSSSEEDNPAVKMNGRKVSLQPTATSDSTSDSSDSEDEVSFPNSAPLVKADGKRVAPNMAADTDSSDSEDEVSFPTSAPLVKADGKRVAPNMAADTDSSSDSTDNDELKANLKPKGSPKLHSKVSKCDKQHSQGPDPKSVNKEKSPPVSRKRIKTKTPTPSDALSTTKLASLLQSAAESMNIEQKAGSIKWDLESLSPAVNSLSKEDTVSNTDTGMSSSNALALLLESAANIIRSASKINSQPANDSSGGKKSISSPREISQPTFSDSSSSDSECSSLVTTKPAPPNNVSTAPNTALAPLANPDGHSSSNSSGDAIINHKLSVRKAQADQETQQSSSSSGSDVEGKIVPTKVQRKAGSTESSSSDSSSDSDSDHPGFGQTESAEKSSNNLSTAQSSCDSDSEVESKAVSQRSSNTSGSSDNSHIHEGVKSGVVMPKLQSKASSSKDSTDSSDSSSDSSNPPSPKTVSVKQSRPTADVASNQLSKKPKKIITVAEKRVLSNQMRLEALANKKKELKSRQSVISQSLSSLDVTVGNKRVVFDSDSENEQNLPTQKKVKTSEIDTEQKKNAKILFEDDSEEEDEQEDFEKMFAVKPQFEGKKGAKLLNLQNTFNDDGRFKLTDKFLESDSEESDEENVPTEPAGHIHDEYDKGTERRRNLEILQSIVGSKNVKIDHPTSAQTKPRKLADTPATVFRDVSSMHFDPTSESHGQLVKAPVVSTEPKKSKKKSKKLEGSEPVVGSEPAPEIDQQRFFEVASDYKNSVVGGQSEEGEITFGFVSEDINASQGSGMTFNFLGDQADRDSTSEKQDCQQEMDVDNMLTTEKVSKKYQNPFDPFNGGKTFDDESDEDEDEDIEEAAIKDKDSSSLQNTEMAQPKTGKGGVATNTVVDWFFFKQGDPRLVDGAKRFSRTLNEQVLRKNWEDIRPKLVENYLLKSKRASKKLKTHRTSVIKKRLVDKSGKSRVKR